MFEKLKELFDNGKLSEVGLNKAVTKGWITEAEAIKISSNADSGSNSEEYYGQT